MGAAIFTWFELERNSGRGWVRHDGERYDFQDKAEAEAVKVREAGAGAVKVVKVIQTRETVARF